MGSREPPDPGKAQLAASEALRIGLLQSALDCVIVMNDQGQVVEWNQAAAETFGYRREVALGRPLAELIVPPRLRAAHSEGLELYLRTGRHSILGQRIEVRAQCADGSEIDVELAVTPVRLKRTLFVGYLRDITEVKQAARELREAKEEAEASSLAKSRFLASISHELRTPLTSILGFAGLLREERQEAPARRAAWLGHIHHSAEHLLALINDLLDLSKIEADQLLIEPHPVQVLEFFERVEASVRPLAEEKGLAFEVRFADPVPQTLQTDALRLRQVLLNLLGNALKFTERGGVLLEVAAAPDPDGKTLLLQVSVEDTGPGVEPEALEGLFAPFRQAPLGRARGGTGLGLAISRQLATLLGGALKATSTPGEGSRFTLTVPAGPLGTAVLVNATEKFDMRALSELAASGGRLAGARLLVVDDHAANRDLVSYLLSRAGAEVEVAASGSECLATWRRGFDAILMDIQMPELDGYETTRRLRRAGATNPVVALTAHSMHEDRERSLAAGCDAYVTKPIDEEQLVGLLEGLLRRGGRPRRARSERSAAAASPSGDPGPLRSERTGDPRFRPLLERFVTSLREESLPRLEAAAAAGDADALRGEAHKLIGSGKGYGFPAISSAAKLLEEQLDAAADEAEVAALSRRLCELVRRAVAD